MAESALKAGCRYILLFGWQTDGHDNGYFYRYTPNEEWGGAEALRKAVQTCREMGVEILPFFNGTLANTTLPEHREFDHRGEAKTRTGHPYYAGDRARHNFDAPTRNRAMLHHEICFCDEQRLYFLNTVKRIVEDYGFGNLQMDQIAEKMFPCYDDSHGHTSPDRAFVDGLLDLLPKARGIVREVNPEGVIVSECRNDFTGQWCDSSWDWRDLLPFPEPILYTLPWLLTSYEVDGLEFSEVNKAFAYKMHIDMKIDGGDEPVTKYPSFSDHIRRNAELRRRVGDYYNTTYFRDQKGLKTEAGENVLVKVFHNSKAGKTGIVVSETGGKKTDVRLSHTWTSSSHRILVDSNLRPAFTVPSSGEIRLSAEPYEVLVLCIDLSEGC